MRKKFAKFTVMLLSFTMIFTNSIMFSFADDGTANDDTVIEISTAEQLQNVKDDLTAEYKLTADIDLEGVSWTPIGDDETAFTGKLDGNGHTISNLDIENNSYYVGLFGCNEGRIENLGIYNANVNATSDSEGAVAALAGFNSGTISKCYVTADVTGNIATVTSNQTLYLGLVSGNNSGTIDNTYSIGTVKSTSEINKIVIGGICGVTSGSVTSCYSLANVKCDSASNIDKGTVVAAVVGQGNVTNSYHLDTTVSGDDNSKSIAVSGEELKDSEKLSGLDFESVWTLEGNDNYQYPMLKDVSMKYSSIDGGKLTVSGDRNLGSTMTASISEIETGEYTACEILWNGDNENMSEGDTYVLLESDMEKTISVVANLFNKSGRCQLTTTFNSKSIPAKGITPIAKEITANSVTLEPVDGYEYSNGGETWQDSNVFEGLATGTEYEFYQRIKASEDSLASEISAVLRVTTKYTQEVPEAPVVESVDENVVTLVANDGYEYSIDGETWQDNNVFELENCTKYNFYQRIKETDYYSPSQISQAISVTTGSLLTVPDGYTGIYTLADLNRIRNDLSGKYILMNNLVFAKADFELGGTFYNGGSGWIPIGSAAFTGVLDGNGYTIKGLYVNTRSYNAGLFGYNNGTIKNLGMVSGSVTNGSDYSYNGGIAGENSGIIRNCYNTGSVKSSSSSSSYSGGITGYNDGEISNSYNTGTVNDSVSNTSVSCGGGIAGLGKGGISNCYNTGTVTNSNRGTNSNISYSGGIEGRNNGGTISGCYNTGSVSSSGSSYSGGITGNNNGGEISNSYNLGNVTNSVGNNLVSNNSASGSGGIVGRGNGTINNCYNMGTVTSNNNSSNNSSNNTESYSGGIEGYNNCGAINNCYNIGSVVSSSSYKSYSGGIVGETFGGTISNSYNIGNMASSGYSGGIAGRNSGDETISNCYYLDCIISGVGNTADSDSIKVLSITEMKKASNYIGFDFEEIWCITESEFLLPQLKSCPHVEKASTTDTFDSGKGTAYDPYVIKTKKQLDAVRNYKYCFFELGEDIEFTEADFETGGDFYNQGAGWNPIGETSDNPFTGTFDGNGHIIKGLYSNSTTQYAGLFGYSKGTISNLGIIDGNIISISYSGGIVGVNYGIIRNSYNTGSVSSSKSGSYSGGVAGNNDGTISNSYNTGNINAELGDSGGIAGRNYGTISNSYNVGIVTGRNGGGITGYNGKTVSNCYCSNRTNCGIGYGTDSDSVKSLTLTEMKDATSYIGFDFENIWDIDNDSTTYTLPVLRSLDLTPQSSITLDLSDCSVESISNQPYTGTEIKPEAEIYYWNSKLTEGQDYTITYGNNISRGTAHMTINGKGLFSGAINLEFEIVKATPSYEVPTGLTATYVDKLSDVKLPDGFTWTYASLAVGEIGEKTFTATYTPKDTDNFYIVENIQINVTVEKLTPIYVVPIGLTATYGQTLSDIELPSGFTWSDSTQSVGNAGTNTFTAAYTPEDTDSYKVINDIEVSVAVDKINPSYEVPTGLTAGYGEKLSDVELPAGFTWTDDTQSVGDVGNKTFTVIYTPEDTNNYNVISDIEVSVTVNKANPIYVVPVNLTATYGKKLSDVTLPAGFAWTHDTKSVGDAGSNTFTVVFTPDDTDNYNVISDIEVKVTVEPKTISGISASLSQSSYVYSGSEIKPTVNVTGLSGSDYTVSYKNNIYPGTATVIITAKGNYTGTITKNFTITAPVLSATSSVSCSLYGYDDIQTNWRAVSGASGYKVYYKKSTSTSYLYKGSTSGTSMKIANLADGAKYYVRVIPYMTINGTNYEGVSKTSSVIYTLKKLGTPKLSKKSSSKVTVKWTNIAGESGYQISRSTSKTKTGTVYTVKTTTGKSKVISSKRGKIYYYKVRAYRTVGSKKIYGPWSSVRTYKLR